MRLSTIGAAATAIAVFLTAVAGTFAARDWMAGLFARDGSAADGYGRTTRRFLAYRGVSPASPLRFTLSRPSREVRLLTIPGIRPEAYDPEATFTYGLELRMFDAEGTEFERIPVFSTALHPGRLLPFKRPVRFVRGSSMPLGLQDSVVVRAARPIAAIEIVPIGGDGSVAQVSVRAYERLPFFGRDAVQAFYRRSPAEQAELAEASALPLELLTDAQRAALMTNRWRALGPAGVAGSDYTVAVVYERPFELPDADSGEEAR